MSSEQALSFYFFCLNVTSLTCMYINKLKTLVYSFSDLQYK